jgi:integrase
LRPFVSSAAFSKKGSFRTLAAFAQLVIHSVVIVWLSLWHGMADLRVDHGSIKLTCHSRASPCWNKGRIVGQKLPLKPKHVWAIRVRLELAENHRDLAVFNMAIDSKLRGCDLVRVKVADVIESGQIKERASVLQSKTQKPVRFEISEGTRSLVAKWMEDPLMVGSEFLWPGRFHERLYISTCQYARIVRERVASIGLEMTAYGTHSMRKTKVTQIYKKTGNLRAVQLLLGHTKMDSTARYLGVELEGPLAIAQAIEI